MQPHPQNRSFAWKAHTGPFRRISDEQARSFDENGYFVLKDAFDAETVARAIAEIDAYERGRYDEAIETLSDITLPMMVTESMSIVRTRADIQLLRGDLAQAVGEYRRYIDESTAIGHGGSTGVNEARLSLAELYLYEGKLDEGIDSLRALANPR